MCATSFCHVRQDLQIGVKEVRAEAARIASLVADTEPAMLALIASKLTANRLAVILAPQRL